jgi:branched-subunit amino acid aminotransferase/4-amino-4-deoxychorismate lyase
LRHALQHGDGDASAQVTLFAADGSTLVSGAAVEPSVLVRTSPPVSWAAPAMRVRSVPFERFLPYVKNADTLGLTLHVRRARADGYDDVVFTTPAGEVSEGSIWNVAFQGSDGAVVWPSAPSLLGITQQVAQRGLDRLGVAWWASPVRLNGLNACAAAVFMNSWTPAQPIASVDGVSFGRSHELAAVLVAAYATQEAQEV